MSAPLRYGPPLWLLRQGQPACGASHRMGLAGDVLCDLPQGHPIDITVQIDGADAYHWDHANRVEKVAWRERYTAQKPKVWAALKGIRIKDPDGWRNETDHYPRQKFGQAVSEREFDARAAVSTIEILKTEEAPVAEPKQQQQQHTHHGDITDLRKHVTEVHGWGTTSQMQTQDVARLHQSEHGYNNLPFPSSRVAEHAAAVLSRPAEVVEEAAADGEAHGELVELLNQLARHNRVPVSHSEIEAVIALAGLVRNERGLTDVDPQDDPGPEELRVQGARRFVGWAEERNLFRPNTDDQWAGFPPTPQGLVTSWLRVERWQAVREDDPVSPATPSPGYDEKGTCVSCGVPEGESHRWPHSGPKVEVYIGDKKLEPDCKHLVEDLRRELSVAMHERDVARHSRIMAMQEREETRAERDQAQARNTELARHAIEKNTEIAVLRKTVKAMTESRLNAGIKPVQPADAAWDFLDWVRIKGWELVSSWPVGPDQRANIHAPWGTEVLTGLVEGWHWARHGQWEHARLNQPTEAPGDEQETTKAPEPGSFAYEHGEPVAKVELVEDAQGVGYIDLGKRELIWADRVVGAQLFVRWADRHLTADVGGEELRTLVTLWTDEKGYAEPVDEEKTRG